MNKVYIYTLDYTLDNFKLPDDLEVVVENNFYRDDSLYSESDIFISLEDKTPLDFRLKYYSIPSEALVIVTKSLDISNLLDDKNLKEHYLNDYAVFSGGRVDSILSEVKDKVNETIKFLTMVMMQMLNAGYLERKNYQKVEDWIISFEHPILKIFKIYHKIETSNPSLDFEEEFLVNPQFREMILIAIMKIISNYVINNDISTLEKISKIGTWKEKKLWDKLSVKIQSV